MESGHTLKNKNLAEWQAGAAFVLGAAKSFKNWTKKAKTNQAFFWGSQN